MSKVLTFFSALFASVRGSRVSRDAEVLFLRQQLLVLRRSAPARLRLRNTDRLIFVWLYRLFPPCSMSIRDRAVAPRSPWQNGYVERLIGSIRRECLDHVVVLGEVHLRRILAAYATYYNGVRTHLARGKDAPLGRPVQTLGRIVSVPILGGLHHHYVRMA